MENKEKEEIKEAGKEDPLDKKKKRGINSIIGREKLKLIAVCATYTNPHEDN